MPETASDARINTELPAHPKTKKLIRRLGESGAWHWIKLICWVAANRPSGDLKGMSGEDIELAIDWTGEPDALVNALLDLGFLDIVRENPLHCRMHDWDDHNPWAMGARARSIRARWAAVKKHHGQATADREVPEYALLMAENSLKSSESVESGELAPATGTKKHATGTEKAATGTKNPATGTKNAANGRSQAVDKPLANPANGTENRANGTKNRASGTENRANGSAPLPYPLPAPSQNTREAPAKNDRIPVDNSDPGRSQEHPQKGGEAKGTSPSVQALMDETARRLGIRPSPATSTEEPRHAPTPPSPAPDQDHERPGARADDQPRPVPAPVPEPAPHPPDDDIPF